MKLFLSKNLKAVEELNKKGETRLPYFRLVVPPEQEGGEWKEVGAFWKAKSGNGYSGKLTDNVKISFKENDEEFTPENVPFD